MAAAPLAILTVRRFLREAPGPGFNRILAQTAQVQTVFAALLRLGATL